MNHGMIRLYFGEAADVRGLVRDLLELGTIGGATILEGNGFWLSPDDGKLYEEPCQILETTYELGVIPMAEQCARLAGEESVFVVLPSGDNYILWTGAQRKGKDGDR